MSSSTFGFFKDIVSQLGGQAQFVGFNRDGRSSSVYWNGTLKQKIKDILQDKRAHTLGPVVRKLRDLEEELVRCRMFSYRTKREEVEGRSYLLKLMQKFVEGIVADDGSKDHSMLKSWEDREFWFSTATSLFLRKEFDLERAGFQVPRKPFVDKEVKGQFSSYRWLLIVMLNHSRKSFAGSREFLEDRESGRWKIKDYEMKFYMSVLALAFFRVPLIQGRVTNAVANALEDRPWPTKRPSATKVNDEGDRSEEEISSSENTSPSVPPRSTSCETRKRSSINEDIEIETSSTTSAAAATRSRSTKEKHRDEEEDACEDRDDVDRILDTFGESFSFGYYSLSAMSLSSDEIRDLLREGNVTIRNIVAKNREAERIFCDCSPSLFDWINLQTEDHKQLLNAQECAIARSTMISSKGDLKSVRELGWDWLDLVVRNGECFALFTRFVIEEIVRHAGKGRDPVEEARERSKRAEMKDSTKAKQLFGALLKKGGNLLGFDKENNDQDGNNGIAIAWHRVPSYFHILRLFCRLLHKMCRLTRSSPPPSFEASENAKNSSSLASSVRGNSPRVACSSATGLTRWSDRSARHKRFFAKTRRWPRIEPTPRCMTTILDTSVAILSNPYLLDLFVHISFSCTSVYDFRAVERCLDRVGKFFTASANALFKIFGSQDGSTRRALVRVVVCMGADPHITERECIDIAPHLLRQLPASFDERYFLHGITMLLESEHAHTLTCALRFLYEYLPLMSDSLRMQIMQRILEQRIDGNTGVMDSVFVRLFCSWHGDVRRVFQHIIAYRMFRVKRTYLALISDKILVGSSDSRHVFLVENPPDVVSQSHYLANDTTLAFSLDFFIDQISNKKRIAKTRRRATAFRSAESPPPKSRVAGDRVASSDDSERNKGKKEPFLFKESLYVYGKKSIAEYARVLVGYYTRALASSDGLVGSVDMAELVFGGSGPRRCD